MYYDNTRQYMIIHDNIHDNATAGGRKLARA